MILQLQDIRLSFTNSAGESFHVLDGLSMQVEDGKVNALVGGNGTGKTTLFNIISGFVTDYNGDVILDGRNIRGVAAYKIARMGVGRLFQGRQLVSELSLLDNMKIASSDCTGENPFTSIFARNKIRKAERAKECKAVSILTELFGSDNKYLAMLNNPAGNISYGEQRLIAIARLMMADNRLLLLDEPTSGVNPKYIETFGTIIKKMVRECGMTVLLIEHNMHFVRSVADNCAYLEDGKIKLSGETDYVLSHPDVKNSYLGI